VQFEPWLLRDPSGAQQYFSQFGQKNRTSNPAIQVPVSWVYSTSIATTWTVTIRNAAGAAVRTISGSGSPATVVWNGANDGGTTQPNGTYRYQVDAVAPNNDPPLSCAGIAVLDTTRALTLGGLSIDRAFISPNGDGVQDTATVLATTSFDDATWTVNVIDHNGTTVRTLPAGGPGNGISISATWDGIDAAGAPAGDGLYTLNVVVNDGTASANASASTTVDRTLPSVAIAAPLGGAILSNFNQSGVSDVAVTGSATDANFTSWTLDYASAGSPNTWTVLQSSTNPVSGGALSTWATGALTNGAFTLRLRAVDRAGNNAAVSVPVNVGNFSVAKDSRDLNVATGASVHLTSTIPFPLTESIVIRNEAGATVRTLLSPTYRTAGGGANTHFTDTWDGKSDTGSLLPDGAYFYVATVTDGSNSLTWNPVDPYVPLFPPARNVLASQPFDPFNNKPMEITYSLDQAAQVSLQFATADQSFDPDCSTLTASSAFCFTNREFQASGPHKITWPGTRPDGVFQAGFGWYAVLSGVAFPPTATVLYGTRPAIVNPRFTPAVFSPAAGTQRIEFDLTTYASQPVTVVCRVINQNTLSTLRTLTLPNQVAGHVSTVWDGKADNGVNVAPGFYTIVINARDAIGNSVDQQAVTTIAY
jgi:flagellar hook assembly protein FlgD